MTALSVPPVRLQGMTRGALEELVSLVAAAKRDDPMAPVTVIVPSNVAGRSVGWRLAAGIEPGRPGIAGVRITTLARLAESIAAARLHPRRPLLPAILAAAWHAELSFTAAEKPDWPFAEVWDHPATVSALTRAYRDLREVSAGALLADRAGTVPAEVLRLSGKVRERLAPLWYDQQDLYAAAAEIVATEPQSLAEFGVCVRYLAPDEFASAAAFLAALQTNHGVATVTESERQLADRVLHASDSDDEVRVVVREVVAALANDQPARRLAILYSRPDPYVPIIQGQLAAAGIACNGRGGIPVLEMAVARAFLGLLAWPGRDHSRAQLFEVLSTWPLRDPDSGEYLPTARWERVSRRANVAGGDSVAISWSRRLDDYASRERFDHRKLEAAQLRDFVTALDARLQRIAASSTWAAMSEQCLAILDELFGGVEAIRSWQHDDKRAFVTLMSVLQELRSLDAHRPPRDLDDLIEVVRAELEATIPRTGKFGQGVFVGPISQGRGLDLDQVWIVGLSEDLYPGRQSDDALLPDLLRANTAGLRSARDRVLALEDDLAAAFASATQVTASFPRGDLRASTEKLPSRLLLPTLRQLVGDPILAATKWASAPKVAAVVDCSSHARGVLSTPNVATSQEWAMRFVTESPADFDDPAFSAARELQAARRSVEFTRFDGNLAGTSGLPDLSTGGLQISPTALEKYATCPFAYFVQSLLRVEPVSEPTKTDDIQPADIGNIFHSSLDRFITAEKRAGTLPAAGEPWTEEQIERFATTASAVLDEFDAQGRLGHPTLWGFQEALVRQELEQMLRVDSAWRAGVGAAPVAAELRFGDGEERPAVEIEVPGGVIRFRGSADKVDLSSDTVYVTDVKTGRSGPFEKIEPKSGGPNPTVDGTKLQLPIYAAAALAAHPDRSQVQAQYWFVHGKPNRDRINLVLTDELQGKFVQTIQALASGIVSGHFFKKPSKDPGYLWVNCQYCTPDGIGHGSAWAGYQAKRTHPDLLQLLQVIDPDAAAELSAGGTEDEEESA